MTLAAHVEAAVAARARLRARPLRETIEALVAAAARWRCDCDLAAALAGEAALSPAMVAVVVPLAAAALDAGAMTELVEREYGPGAAARPVPDGGPALVAHVLASSVPALALPAVALGCLAGAAVVLKSGRRDRSSAPAFARALAAVDADLAATVVPAYWERDDEDADVLARADVTVVTGGEAALAALAGRVRGRLVAHGPRASLAAVGAGADPDALALDIALYEQRGCLSPHAVYVDGDARAFAAALAAALERTAVRLPPPPAGVEERAARRLFAAEAEWTPGGAAWSGAGGTVVLEETRPFRPTCGLRSVLVHPLARLDDLPALLPAGGVECVALADTTPAFLAALRARGVARVCPPGRMQQPRLSWPRGQLAPLGALRGRAGGPLLEVER